MYTLPRRIAIYTDQHLWLVTTKKAFFFPFGSFDFFYFQAMFSPILLQCFRVNFWYQSVFCIQVYSNVWPWFILFSSLSIKIQSRLDLLYFRFANKVLNKGSFDKLVTFTLKDDIYYCQLKA